MPAALAADVEDEAFDFGAADVVDEAGFNRGAPGRQLVDDGHVQVGEKLMASVRGMGVADIISWWTSRPLF